MSDDLLVEHEVELVVLGRLAQREMIAGPKVLLLLQVVGAQLAEHVADEHDRQADAHVHDQLGYVDLERRVELVLAEDERRLVRLII